MVKIKDIFLKLVAKGNDTYKSAPKAIRWLFLPLRLIHKITKVFRLDLWIIRGNETSSGQELTIMFAGREYDKNYFTDLAFGDSCNQDYLGRKWLWNILKAAKYNKYNCSLSIVETPRKLLRLPEKQCCFYIPNWVVGEIDMQQDKPEIFSNRNESLRSDIRRLKKSHVDFEVTKDISQLENFHFNMHEPYIRKIYDDQAVIAHYNDVKRNFVKNDQDLLLIKKDSDYIAGAILDHTGKWARLSTLGIKNGDPSYIQNGVMGAIYYFSIQYLEKKGFEKISLGGSRPFLKDGVIQYKKKWYPKLSQRTKSGYFIKMLMDTEGARGFFINNPFIWADEFGLNGVVFVEDKKVIGQKDFKTFYKSYYQRGLSNLIIYKFETVNNTDCSIQQAFARLVLQKIITPDSFKK